MNDNELIRFDWAMKRLLRDKANFGVLEGLITTLLGKTIKIKKLLESESNQENSNDKQNRVDVLAEDDQGVLYLIEIQNETEFAYFQRMLFGTSKLVTEYINRGQGYENVRKVYSINIVYFNLGNGTDIVYHGKTEFRGIHNGDLLSLSPFQQQKFEADTVSDLYPEYYILKVNDFNHWSKVPLEQWIYFLNTGQIPDDSTAPGLDEARQKLQLARMSKQELAAYYRHLDNIVILRDNIVTAKGEGYQEGMAEGYQSGMVKGMEQGYQSGMVKGMEKGMEKGIEKGMAQGAEQERIAIARSLKTSGIDTDTIARSTGLTKDVIDRL